MLGVPTLLSHLNEPVAGGLAGDLVSVLATPSEGSAMLRIEMGHTRRYCDGISRRSFVQLGVAGMASATLAQVLRAKERASAGAAKDTAAILIWLDGGPGHMDTYDLKPQAPPEYRGIWRPIKTNVSGMEVTELFPLQAKAADKFSILRSLHHDNGDHFTAAHLMLTSRGGPNGSNTAGHNPGIGSVISKTIGPRRAGLPAYVAVPYGMSVGLRPGYFGANYLGVEHNPFETGGDPNSNSFKVDNLGMGGGLTVERLADREHLRQYFDGLRRQVDNSGALAAVDRFQQRAYQMVTGPEARQAFDIASEDDKTRELYGRHTWGQSCLLARRLVEAGTTFVTVHFGGWDHHWDLQKGMENYLPKVDQCVAGLLTDLEQRGLSKRVLVILCGEFSRTPKMNDGGNGGAPLSKGTPGRDHWGNSMFCLLAGGGVKGGRMVGSTNRLGEQPQDRPATVGDLHATIYHLLGVDPHTQFLNHAGRPVPAIDRGEVIRELL